MVSVKWLIEKGFDEIAAMILIVAGIVYIFCFDRYQEGLGMTTIGTGYLFGKSSKSE